MHLTTPLSPRKTSLLQGESSNDFYMVVITNGMLLHERFAQAFPCGIFQPHNIMKVEMNSAYHPITLPTDK